MPLTPSMMRLSSGASRPTGMSITKLLTAACGKSFHTNLGQEEFDTPPSKSVTTVVTPGGNEASRSKKVRLSPSQVSVANRLGVPLEEYAKQFVALDS